MMLFIVLAIVVGCGQAAAPYVPTADEVAERMKSLVFFTFEVIEEVPEPPPVPVPDPEFSPGESEAKPENVVPPEFEPYYVLHMATADFCGPCQKWKATEAAKVNCEVVYHNYPEDKPYWADRFPTFRLVLHKSETDEEVIVTYVGFTSADTLNSKMLQESK